MLSNLGYRVYRLLIFQPSLEWSFQGFAGISSLWPSNTSGNLDGADNGFDHWSSSQSAGISDESGSVSQMPLSLMTETRNAKGKTMNNNLSESSMELDNSVSIPEGWSVDSYSTGIFSTSDKSYEGSATTSNVNLGYSPLPESTSSSDIIAEFIDTLTGIHRKLYRQSTPISPDHDCDSSFSGGKSSSHPGRSVSSQNLIGLDGGDAPSPKPSIEVLEIDKVFDGAQTLHHALSRLPEQISHGNKTANQIQPSRWDHASTQRLDGATLFLLVSCYMRVALAFKASVAEINRCLQPHYTSKDLMEVIALPNMQIGSFTPPQSSNMRIALVLQLTTHLLDRIDKEATQVIRSIRENQPPNRRPPDDIIDSALRIMQDLSATIDKEANSLRRKLEESTSM